MNRSLLKVLLSLAAVTVAALPLVLALVFGLQHARLPGDIGEGTGIYIVLAVVYVVWLPLTFVGLVFVFDRVGIHYAVGERRRKPTEREKRRLSAGLRFLGSRPTLGSGPASRRDRASGPAAGSRRDGQGRGKAGGHTEKRDR